MPQPRIYTPQVLREGIQITLEEAASRHLASALRLQIGQALCLFNGQGGQYQALIASLERKAVVVEVGSFENRSLESPLRIHLGIAVSRGERMDWVIQKGTELGVAQLTPLFSERTEVKLRAERATRKLRHWQQIAISSCEQCGRNTLPAIHELQQLPSWCETVQAERKLVLHHRTQAKLAATSPPTSLALLVGPEGGLSDDEIETAQRQGFTSLALGARILRTETAPLAAMAILQAQWGDMNP